MDLIDKLGLLFSRREKLIGLLLVGAMFVGAGFEVLSVGLVLPFIAMINEPELVLNAAAVRPYLQMFDIHDQRDLLIIGGLAMILIYTVKSGYLVLLYHSVYRFVFRKQVTLSRELLQEYVNAPYVWHLRRNTAEMVKNTTETLQRFTAGFMIAGFITLAELLVVAALVAFLAIVAPAATLGALVLVGVPTCALYWVVRRRLAKMGNLRERSFAAMVRWTNQALGGLKQTKVSGRGDFFLERHGAHVEDFAQALRTFMFFSQLPRSVVDSIVVVGMVAVVVVITASGKDIRSVLPLWGMFAVAAMRLTPSVNRISVGLSSLRFHFAAADVIYRELRETRRQCGVSDDRPNRQILPEPFTFQNAIVLERVSFRYPGGEKVAVLDISLTVPKGHSIALIGTTGSGKTTIVDLVLGLLTPTEGHVLVDGRDVRENIAGWQRNIGYVPQNVYLMDDTIRRNVAFALPDSEIDDDRVWRALRAARLEDMVRALPAGLDTSVEERGVRLSGGECQRLGIARALYLDPEVLVLDEATAALDSDTEAAITRMLEDMRGKMTLIMIAHSLPVVRNCDRVFLVEGGRIEDSGSYADMLSASSKLRERAETHR